MKPSNPFLTPNYEAALEALTRGPLTSNTEGVLIRPVDQLAEAVRSLHEQNKTLHAVIAGDFNMKSFRKVCADNARLRTLLQEWNDLAQYQGISTQTHRNRTAAALAAQPPATSKCECIIERNPARMSAAALEAGASAEIVGPLCAYCKAKSSKSPAPAEGITDTELLDLLGSLGDNGEVVIDGDLEGERVVLSWNAWGDIKTPREALAALRAAIDSARAGGGT